MRGRSITLKRSTGRENQRAGERERLAVATWFVRAGFTVVNFSQPGLPRGQRGRRGTFQTAGIPDLRIYDPRGIVPPIWFEVKAGNGVLSPAQRAFKTLCEAQHQEVYIHGGVERAKGFLRHVGCLVLRDGIEVLQPLEVAA